MTSIPSESSEPADSSHPEKDTDPTPAVIPLRQRRLPASFWQEPSTVHNPPSRDNTNPRAVPSVLPFPQTASQYHPWSLNMGGGGATLPTFLPQRLGAPGSYAMVHHPASMWMRSPSLSYCNCAVCLNYSCVAPRIPDMYSGLRYASCSPGSKCADLSCKLCASSVNWYPDRVRQSRFRSSRYNALLD